MFSSVVVFFSFIHWCHPPAASNTHTKAQETRSQGAAGKPLGRGPRAACSSVFGISGASAPLLDVSSPTALTWLASLTQSDKEPCTRHVGSCSSGIMVWEKHQGTTWVALHRSELWGRETLLCVTLGKPEPGIHPVPWETWEPALSWTDILWGAATAGLQKQSLLGGWCHRRLPSRGRGLAWL